MKTIEAIRTPKVVRVKRTHVPSRSFCYQIGNEVFQSIKEIKSVFGNCKIIIKEN